MINWVLKFIISLVLSQSFFLWIGPRLVMAKLDKDLHESRINFREECGKRWVDGIIYPDPICIGDAASSRKPNPDFIYTIIPYDFYKITNTEIEKDSFQFIISKDKTFKHNLPIAYASSNNGVILIRLTMKYFNEYDALDNFRRSTTKQYLKTL